MVKYMTLVILFIFSLNLDCFAKREIKLFSLSDTTKLEVILGDIDLLYINGIYLDFINNLDSCKVKAIQFYGCIGDVNHIFKQVDKSKLSEIFIENCNLKLIPNKEKNGYESIDLSGVKENNLHLSIENSNGIFEFTNEKSLKSLVVNNSNSLTLDFSRLNKSFANIALLNVDPFFLHNLTSISEFDSLITLRLEFIYPITERLDLKKCTKLRDLILTNFKFIPKNISTRQLETFSIDKIYNFELEELSKIISQNLNINYLGINNCNLYDIPKSINMLEKLRDLSLSNNKLSTIEYDFEPLYNLQYIYLDNNLIAKFNYKLFNLPMLRQLNIEFNALTKRISNSNNKKIIINQDGNPFTE